MIAGQEQNANDNRRNKLNVVYIPKFKVNLFTTDNVVHIVQIVL
jgi:hypothetical protein